MNIHYQAQHACSSRTSRPTLAMARGMQLAVEKSSRQTTALQSADGIAGSGWNSRLWSCSGLSLRSLKKT